MHLNPALIISSFIIAGIFRFDFADAQNIIPNGSFEDGQSILNQSQNSWQKYFGHDTPDYFNLGKSDPHNDLFDKYMGGASPYDGNAFMGIFCYRVHPMKKARNIREFLEAELLDTLEKDSAYTFEISLQLDEESNVCLRNFGVIFSEKRGAFRSESEIFTTPPDIAFDEVWLDNASGWITLEAAYYARGNEKFIMIGNLFPDYRTRIKKREDTRNTGKKKKWKLTRQEMAAYYYIDALSLEKSNVDAINHITLPNIIPPGDFNLDTLKKERTIVLRNINFIFNTAAFTEKSYPELERLFRLMQDHPDLQIQINGYTDNLGSRKYNLRLSELRAKAVKDFLVTGGIDPARITCEGFGFEQPIRPNDSEKNRQLNRRVEFIIIEPDR
jgi:outer membrane protein OmpA-like peptidoglycan-associated protein